MKLLNTKYFTVCLLIYLTIQLARYIKILPLGFLNNYLTDLVCMPVVLCLVLALLRVIKRSPHLILPWHSVLLVLVYWSWYFEWYLPGTSSKFTGDFVDVLMYIMGAFSFIIFQRKELKKPWRQEYYQ
jgi:hypothetical protein